MNMLVSLKEKSQCLRKSKVLDVIHASAEAIQEMSANDNIDEVKKK